MPAPKGKVSGNLKNAVSTSFTRQRVEVCDHIFKGELILGTRVPICTKCGATGGSQVTTS